METLPISIRTERPDIEEEERIRQLHDFYNVQVDPETLSIKKITFDKYKLVQLLKSLGVYRYDLDDGAQEYVRVVDNKIMPMNESTIKDVLENYIADLPPRNYKVSDSKSGTSAVRVITAQDLVGVLYNNLMIFNTLIDRLRPDAPIQLLRDNKNTKYLFWKNVAVAITREGITPMSYERITDGKIWTSAILERDFNYTTDRGDYEAFIEDICSDGAGSFSERKNSLMSIIGYLMHDYYGSDLRAALLTDVNINNEGDAAGGTGKGLIGKGLDHILNRRKGDKIYVPIAGKGFVATDDRRYDVADITTAVIHIEDIDKRLNIEQLYNDITDGATFRRVYRDKSRKMIKMMLSTNHTIDIRKTSTKRRLVVFELANYYNDHYRPIDKYHKRFFEDEWTADDWSQFDSFMCRCAQVYLEHGIIEPKEINYSERTLHEMLPDEFIEFCVSEFKPYTADKLEGEFDKEDLYNRFCSLNLDYQHDPKFNRRRMTKWLKTFCDYKMIPNCQFRSTNDYFYIYPSRATMAKAKGVLDL